MKRFCVSINDPQIKRKNRYMGMMEDSTMFRLILAFMFLVVVFALAIFTGWSDVPCIDVNIDGVRCMLTELNDPDTPSGKIWKLELQFSPDSIITISAKDLENAGCNIGDRFRVTKLWAYIEYVKTSEACIIDTLCTNKWFAPVDCEEGLEQARQAVSHWLPKMRGIIK